MRILLFISLVLLLLFNTANAQIELTVGAYAGGGFIKGNSPDQSSFSTSVFIETNTPLFEEVYPRVSFIYAQDFNILLPDTRQRYHPFIKGFSLKGITSQYFDSRIFLEEGVGFLMLNDRTFSDVNEWNAGMVLSLAGGLDFRDFDLKGFKIGAGMEYGLTFTNTLAQFFSLHIQMMFTI